MSFSPSKPASQYCLAKIWANSENNRTFLHFSRKLPQNSPKYLVSHFAEDDADGEDDSNAEDDTEDVEYDAEDHAEYHVEDVDDADD